MQSNASHCDVHFDIRFDFKSLLHAQASHLVFDDVCRTMMLAFEKRAADQLNKKK